MEVQKVQKKREIILRKYLQSNLSTVYFITSRQHNGVNKMKQAIRNSEIKAIKINRIQVAAVAVLAIVLCLNIG